MATECLMPKQGNTVESCVILEWKVDVGDTVSVGDILCEAETDKATIEVESEADGTVLKKLYNEGDDVPVMTPMLIVGKPGEDVSAWENKTVESADSGETGRDEGTAEAAPDERVSPAASPAAVSPESKAVPGRGVSPRAKKLAAEKGVSLEGAAGSGPEGRVIERDVLELIAGRPAMTGAAADAAAAGGQVPSRGSGIGGRVLSSDVSRGSQPVAETAGAAAFTEIPVKGARKVTAERMLHSLTQTAQLTLNASAPADRLLEYRKRLKASDNPQLQGITVNDLMLFAVSRVVPEFPELNAHFLGDTIRRFSSVNLGFAVDTPRGLLVPVIRNADQKSLVQISAEAKALIEKSQSGKIAPEDMAEGTFTITNLGSLGIESFTPVLNPPQVGILGICAASLKPVKKDGEVVFRNMMGLSLTFDHQATDGAPAGRFMKRFCEALDQFELLLAV